MSSSFIVSLGDYSNRIEIVLIPRKYLCKYRGDK